MTIGMNITVYNGTNATDMPYNISMEVPMDNLYIQFKMENSKVIINSNNIELGEGATQAVIRGDAFKQFFDTHVHAGAGSPPVVPMIPNLLSLVTKTK
jgi:hypothetical protein